MGLNEWENCPIRVLHEPLKTEENSCKLICANEKSVKVIKDRLISVRAA
jgi:hypothetical protein